MNSAKISAEKEVREAIEQIAKAIRGKDINVLIAYYAPDVVAYDLLPPMQYGGADALRKRVLDWFSSFQGPIEYELKNLSVAAGEDVAFCHSLNGVKGTTRDGATIDMWWRATLGFRKIKGQWLVTHGHSSEPFEMASLKAQIDLKP